MKLLNAFSLNMVTDLPVTVVVEEIDLAEAKTLAIDCESAVGHADTAAVFGAMLECPVACNRATVTLQPGDNALVGQYSGPRLPEGASLLPEGASIKWLVVTVG